MRTRNPDQPIVRATLLLASMMVVLGGAVMAPALPAISAEFQDVPNVAFLSRLVLTLPALFIALCSPIAGFLVDTSGRKRILIASIILVVLGGIWDYFVSSLTMLLIGRAIVGVAVAGLMTSATTLIADYYSGAARSRILGLQAGFMGLGASVIVQLVGVLADINWRTPFLLYLLPLAVLPLIIIVLYEPNRGQRCKDDPPTVGEPGACVGEANFQGQPAIEEPAKAMPVKLITFVYVFVVLAEIMFILIPLQLPFYLQELTSASATESGFAILVTTLSFALTSIFLSKWATRYSHLTVLMMGFSLIGLGLALVSMMAGTVAMYPGLLGVGVGLGLLIPNLYAWLANEAPLAVRGRVMGGFTTAVFGGQFLSPVVSQPLTAVYDVDGTYQIAAVVLLALIVVVFLTRSRLDFAMPKPA